MFINNYKYAPHVSDALRVRNMWSILVVVNKHYAARLASCWFIIYYRILVHGNSNIKFTPWFDRLEKLRIDVTVNMNVEGFFLPLQYVRQARVHGQCQLFV